MIWHGNFQVAAFLFKKFDVYAFVGLKMLRQHSVIKTFRKLCDYVQQTVDFFLHPVIKKFEKSNYVTLFQWFHSFSK